MVRQLAEQERYDRWAAVVARAWDDPAFAQQVLAAPRPILAAAGMDVPPSWGVQVVEEGTPAAAGVVPYMVREEGTGSPTLVLLLHAKPADLGELDDAQLESVAGGCFLPSFCCCCSCASR